MHTHGHSHNHDYSDEDHAHFNKITTKKHILTVSVLFLMIFLLGIAFNFTSLVNLLLVGNLNSEQLEPGSQTFYLARIENATELGFNETTQLNVQDVEFKILSGELANQSFEIENTIVDIAGVLDSQYVSPGELVVVMQSHMSSSDPVFFIYEKFRLIPIVLLALIFLGITYAFARTRGVTSLLGLAFSFGVLVFFLIPQILNGSDPLVVATLSAIAISVVSLYLAHGLNKNTSIAVASTLICVILAVIASVIFVDQGKIFGLGSEDATYLRLGNLSEINTKGLFLAGIIIGVLGVLDDITTAQVATVAEIKKANKKLKSFELLNRGISVGIEHITSLINTLILAYAGVSLPLLLLFTTTNDIPIWVTLNSELIAEEIVRSIVGSLILVLAVPISTGLAAYFYSKE